MADLALAKSIGLNACIPDTWDETSLARPPAPRGACQGSGGGAAATAAPRASSEGGAPQQGLAHATGRLWQIWHGGCAPHAVGAGGPHGGSLV
jgi:hypothetical protein